MVYALCEIVCVVDADRFKVRIAEQDKYYSAETFVTPKGMAWLDGLLNPST